MRKTTHLAMVLSLALVIAIQAGPAISAPPATHESILDRHHLLYGTVIPDPTDAPYGIPGDWSDCLSCHALDTSTGIDQFVIERDCRACHDRDRHHPLYSAATSHPTDAPDGIPGEPYVCLSCHTLDTSTGSNEFAIERDCRVCHQPTSAVTVVVDIKPGTRRNRVGLRSRAPLSISIRGTPDYDVTEIDVSSLLLEGEVQPLRWRFKRRARGYTDLKLRFSSEAVRDALGDLQSGQTYEVCITGRFNDGTRILGSDSFLAVGRPPRSKSSAVMKFGERTLLAHTSRQISLQTAWLAADSRKRRL
jgi:hypothetical protein